MVIKIKLVEGGKMPVYKTDGAAGADCYARIASKLGISIPRHSRCLVNLGFCLDLPAGYEAQIRPRSSLSFAGIDIAVGTIDSDYRGEVKAQIINTTDNDYDIYNGDRVCQMIIQALPKIRFKTVDELSETKRGINGFGSTGRGG